MFAEIGALLGALLRRAGEYQSRALLSVVYWTAIAGTAGVLRLTGRRAMDPRTDPDSFWVSRKPAERDRASRERQY